MVKTDTNLFTRGGSRAVRAAALLFLILLCARSAVAEERFIDYLYVEANEGDSSGGHAALRLDRYTFHFQHERSGLIEASRFDSDAFDYVYAKLGNRPIHRTRIAVGDETYRAVEDTFTRFLLVQEAQLEERDALARDVRLLDVFLAQRAGDIGAAVPLPAAGYFVQEATVTAAGVRLQGAVGQQEGEPALSALRRKVRDRYGATFLEERQSRLLEELKGADLQGAETQPSFYPGRYPKSHSSPATRYYLAASEAVALAVLQGALPLQTGSYWESDDPALRLSAAEVEALSAYGDRMEEDLVRLVDSRRPDRAAPLLVGMARLCALREAVARQRLVVLDFFAHEGEGTCPAGACPGCSPEPPYLKELEAELRRVVAARRADFFGGAKVEGDFTALERAANLLLETVRAGKVHVGLRKAPVPSLPARPAQLVPLVPAGATQTLLERQAAAAREAERGYDGLLQARYGYDLIHRNCVTELFTVLNRTMAELCASERGESCSDKQVREESVQRLGGYVDPGSGLVFIPFLSAERVSGEYRVAAQADTPSYRQEKMALMREKEAPLKVFLRESNTVTSTIYRPGPDDSFFLFFTDNAGVLRPVFGAFNLLAGVGETLYGVATLPVQGTRHLVAGVKGIFFSVPELFFFSIRKGSMGYVEREGE